ncbi:MAG: MobA/MobL family protein, partial [Bacteroidaceae bacterium]|nr:MobA/MobL family protein [Bacteroidaceae bacterium]
ISLCQNAPAEYADRATLWNAVHEIEKAKTHSCGVSLRWHFRRSLAEPNR